MNYLYLKTLIVNIYLSSVNKEKVNAAGLFFVDGVIGKFHNHLLISDSTRRQKINKNTERTLFMKLT